MPTTNVFHAVFSRAGGTQLGWIVWNSSVSPTHHSLDFFVVHIGCWHCLRSPICTLSLRLNCYRCVTRSLAAKWSVDLPRSVTWFRKLVSPLRSGSIFKNKIQLLLAVGEDFLVPGLLQLEGIGSFISGGHKHFFAALNLCP